PFFARDFPFLNFLERPRTRLKARVWRGKGISYVITFKLIKNDPRPLSRVKESHHKVLACITRHFFRILRGVIKP
ncbi:hypothetical protein, partial [Streptococcus lutetiensis]|uniref:hypothetical protein n=1 Tax=Streptococcus lutetiensis TaxID=150055 RepID=UPI001BDAD39E